MGSEGISGMIKRIDKIINFIYCSNANNILNFNKYLESENSTEIVEYEGLQIAYGYYIKRIDKNLIYNGVEINYETNDNRFANNINYECLYYLGAGYYVLEDNMRNYIKYILKNNINYDIEILGVEEWIIKGLVE